VIVPVLRSVARIRLVERDTFSEILKELRLGIFVTEFALIGKKCSTFTEFYSKLCATKLIMILMTAKSSR
jgi:hypothetical protein